jgi:hypothetical protein
MPAYDGQHFNPPAPTASVSLRNPQTGASVPDVVLLIDSGADVTLLPRPAVEQLGVTPDSTARYELVGFDGQRSMAEAIDLDMTFLDTVIRGRFLLTHETIGILGRDVLNFFVVVMDGPAREWSSPKQPQN